MSDLTKKQRAEYLQDRREWKEQFFSTPWYRKLFKKIEHLNKRLTLGLLGKLLHVRPHQDKFLLDELSSILILRTDAIGDMIATTPLWRILKARKPELKIGVAGSFRNLEILSNDPDIDFLYDFAVSDKKLKKAEFARARAEKYDLVIACKFDQKTRSAILARKASKLGYSATIVPDNGEQHHKIISHTVKLPDASAPMPMILQLQYLLEDVISLEIAPEERAPSIIIDPLAFESVKKKVAAILDGAGCRRLVVINTESATSFREWGYKNNYLLASELSASFTDTFFFLTSSPLREGGLVKFLAAKTPHAKIGYFSTSTLHELAALIRLSSLVVSPDTSVIHFASAEKKPTIGFYVQHNPWLPFGVPARVFIPSKEKPVESIPLNIVLPEAIDLLNNSNTAPKSVDIFWCEDPVRIERLGLD
ncbi:MAG: glycosyltransferase family 9 protein [Ignavibacteriota bacterium]